MITVVIMVGAVVEPIDPVKWVYGAQRAAAQDLLEQLSKQAQIDRVIVVSPSVSDLDASNVSEWLTSEEGPIHIGRWLAKIAIEFDVDRLLYFGGGSAPLLSDQHLSDVIEKLAAASEGVITNNRFASDWAGIVSAKALYQWTERIPKDNMIGWVLSTEAGLPIEDLPPSAASRMDIDTPTDLLTLDLHPQVKSHLRRFLSQLSLNSSPLRSLLKVMRQRASHIFVAGRLAPEAWQVLNRSTESWIRVISEERGMISSGRLARGEVFSILGSLIESKGLDSFFDMLADHCQAALIDNRVLLAHRGKWPSEQDRFASDLGFIDKISDPWLRKLTIAARDVPIPVIMGGHGLLAGDLFALCEIL
jgi:CTP:molybdopterin cytidylyltransferase MocA